MYSWHMSTSWLHGLNSVDVLGIGILHSQCTFAIVHYKMYTVQRTPYTVHRTPYNVQRTPYNVHRTTYNVRRTPYNVHRTPYNVHRTPYSVRRTTYAVPCTLYNVHIIGGLDNIIELVLRKSPNWT